MKNIKALFITAVLVACIVGCATDQRIQSTPDISVLDDHDGFSLSDLVNRDNRFSASNQIPMFKVEAITFKCIEETGLNNWGSDEVIVVWNAANSPGANTKEFSSVDAGETKEFHQLQSCIYPINYDGYFINGNAPHVGEPTDTLAGWECVAGGGMGPINFRFAFYEIDEAWHDFFSPCFDGSVDTGVNTCNDDFIGGSTISFTVDELIEMLPNVGSSKNFNITNYPTFSEYHFRYRITRMDNIMVPWEVE